MDPKKIRRMYMQALPNLNKALQFVQSQLSDVPPSDFLLETNVKPYHSAKRKMLNGRFKDPTELSDLVRGRLFFSTQFSYQDVLKLVKQLFGDKIKNIDVNHEKDHGLNYEGVYHVDLDLDGINFELQVMPLEFKPHKDFLHNIYTKLRDKNDKLSDNEKDFLRNIHNKMYKVLSEQARANRKG